MKAFLQRLFSGMTKPASRGEVGAQSDAEVYVYPNDEDASMEEAVGAIWRWYVKLGRRARISVQGMGSRLDSYDCHEARLVDGVLAWDEGEGATEEQRRQPDAIEVGSEEEFRRVFLDWAKKRVTPWEDSGELAFGVLRVKKARPHIANQYSPSLHPSNVTPQENAKKGWPSDKKHLNILGN